MRDIRACSGPWSGFYVEDGRRHSMPCRLRFEGDRFSGEGVDPVGAFTIEGFYVESDAQVEGHKQYRTHDVQYLGTWDGAMVVGHWRIGETFDEFELWPDSEEASIEAQLNSVAEPARA